MAKAMKTPAWLGTFVGAVLRSPLHGAMSRGLLMLTVRGRRSGRAITLPVSYDEAPDALYVFASAPESKTWWRNLSPDRPVTALVRGRSVELVPEVLRWTDGSAKWFESALARYLKRFGFIASALGVTKGDGGFDAASLRAAAQSVVMVRLMKPKARAA